MNDSSLSSIWVSVIIEEGSPLRRLPVGADFKMALLSDGVRYSIDIADISYQRLYKTLVELTDNRNHNQRKRLSPIALADAWSIIDSVNKLRLLLKHMIKESEKKKPQEPKPLRTITNVHEIEDIKLYEFIETTKDITLLRNASQHLSDRIDHLISKKKPICGLLYWVDSRTIKGDAVLCYARFDFGKSFRGKQHIKFPQGPKLEYPIGSITLTAHDYSINLSDLIVLLKLVVKNLEKQWEPVFKQYPRMDSDVIFKAVIEGRTS